MRNGSDDRTCPRPVRRGFTLVELLVVLGIIAMLMGLILGVVSMVKGEAKKTEMATLLYDMAQACEQFKIQYNQYPWPPLKADWDAIEMKKVAKELDPANDKLYPDFNLDDAEKDYTKLTFRINRSKISFLKIPDKFLDPKDGKFIDIYGEEIQIRLDPTSGTPVIWSKGMNKKDETSPCYDPVAKKWTSQNFGDDIVNR
ncbi:MAG: type II secretion system GspH family protein [Planctomycetota bacterium]|nr:type II secretion system GspH family protein [Planctomycetota bacterium]